MLNDFPFEPKNQALRDLRELLDGPSGQAFQQALRTEKQLIADDRIIAELEHQFK